MFISDLFETTGDRPFDNMMKGIAKGAKKQATADRKQQKQQSQERARAAFGNMFGGGNPADQLSIRKKGDVAENAGGLNNLNNVLWQAVTGQSMAEAQLDEIDPGIATNLMAVFPTISKIIVTNALTKARKEAKETSSMVATMKKYANGQPVTPEENEQMATQFKDLVSYGLISVAAAMTGGAAGPAAGAGVALAGAYKKEILELIKTKGPAVLIGLLKDKGKLDVVQTLSHSLLGKHALPFYPTPKNVAEDDVNEIFGFQAPKPAVKKPTASLSQMRKEFEKDPKSPLPKIIQNKHADELRGRVHVRRTDEDDGAWPFQQVNELSNDTLASYKKKAGADASAADQAGNTKKADQRFSGIVRATKKQFANDAKQGVAGGSEDTIYPNAEVIKSKNGKPVGEIYQDGNSWGAFHYKADRGYDFIDSREEAIEALKDLHQETGRSRPDYTIKGVAEGSLNELAPSLGFSGDDDDDKYTPADFGKPFKANYLGQNKFEVFCRKPQDPSNVIKLNAEVQKYGLEWEENFGFWFLDSPGAVYLSWKYGEIPLPKAIDQARNTGHIHDLVVDYLTNSPHAAEIQKIATGYFGFTADGEMSEGLAEGWQEESQDLEDWSKEVNKKLYRAHENQRRSLAIQLSKLEQKHFGSELTNGPLTNIVFSTLQALNKGQMVHYDPQSVGQMPFGSIVGDEARMIAASGMKKYDIDGYRGLRRAGIVDNFQQFLHLRDLADNQGQAILKYTNMPPVAAWMQFIKDIGWSKDDMNEEVQAKTDDKLLAYYAQRKAEKQKQQQGVAEAQHSESCPHCGGEMVSEELMNEKKDACYYKVKSRYKVWPSAYASGALVKCRNKGASNWGNGGKKNESSILEGINRADESLHDWFNKEKWVRMDTKGKIKGPCAKEPGEGKPKCLPQSKAHSLGKKGRASAAQRKRREDPNPDRSGKAINVDTKKSKG